MRELKSFASESAPLHASGVPVLMECPWRMAELHMLTPTDEGGPAGDTGSAMHLAAAELHRGKEVAECIAAMGANRAKYPQADLADAAQLFLKYASDPRNREAQFALVEESVSFSLEPAPEDPTGQPVVLVGRLDQCRIELGRRKRVWDIKTTKKDPVEALNSATYQMAVYCVGASVLLNEPVDPGGIIMPRLYTANPASSPVFRYFPWRFEDTVAILEGVRHAVANVRAGRLWHVPNPNCRWCHRSSPDLCLPALQELRIKQNGRSS